MTNDRAGRGLISAVRLRRLRKQIGDRPQARLLARLGEHPLGVASLLGRPFLHPRGTDLGVYDFELAPDDVRTLDELVA